MCLDTPPPESECQPIRVTTVLQIKPYVYEIVNGKRKRVSPLVIKNGVVTKIHERGIVSAHKL